MSMYRPAAFASDDLVEIARVLDEYPFATLITDGTGEPQVSHLPLLHRSDPAPHGVLIGHMARANPHWRHLDSGASLAIFHGPHAYVSPSWYAHPAAQVPTWNYVVVHVHGRAEVVDDRAATMSTLQQMVGRFEGGRAAPWRLQLEGARLDAMVGAIVAFRITIERIEAKFKLSQNRDTEDRKRVAAALRKEAFADATATAVWMERGIDGD
jgi:transcriptional regulator